MRLTDVPRAKPAVLLLNLTDQDVGLAGWSLATARDVRLSLAGVLTAGQPLVVDVPKAVFDAAGGVTILDASGLKVAAATYPPTSDARRAGVWPREADCLAGASGHMGAAKLARLRRWRPNASKLSGSSQRSKADLRAGHSLSRIENQQVSRLRAL